jgi:site-specific recombinase XerD
MSDQKRAFRPPWQITRNLFLGENEVENLLKRLLRVPPAASERQAALAARDRLLVEALLFSGLRNSELCGLRIADTVVGTGQSVFRVHGTPRQDRTVYVPARLSALVEEFLLSQRPTLVHSSSKIAHGHEPLLVNDRGNAFDRTMLYRRVAAILTAAGLGDRARTQLLRHTYGYLAYKRSGGNLLFIQRQMGHAHPMVSSVYAQFCEEDYSEIADRVGQSEPSGSSPPKPSFRAERPDVRSRRNPRPRSSRDR